MKRVLSLGWFLSAVVMLASCGSKEQADAGAAGDNNASQTAGLAGEVGQFQFAAYDTHGQIRQSREWIGKQPVVVNFWGTWCPPCRREIPDLVRVYKEFKPAGVEIVSIALNDTADKVNVFVASHGMEWVQLLGSEEVAMQFGTISAVPTTVFISRDGREVRRIVGLADYGQFKNAFEEISKS